MNTQEKERDQNKVKAVYEKPAIEIIEMEHEGSILAGSDYQPGGGGGDW